MKAYISKRFAEIMNLWGRLPRELQLKYPLVKGKWVNEDLMGAEQLISDLKDIIDRFEKKYDATLDEVREDVWNWEEADRNLRDLLNRVDHSDLYLEKVENQTKRLKNDL